MRSKKMAGMGIKIKFIKAPIILVFGLVVGMCFTSNSFADTDVGTLSDGQIIAIYNQVNTFDIEATLLAVHKGHSQKVRQLTETVSADHRGVRMIAANLATTINARVSLPSARQNAARQHYQTMVTLAKMDGANFDRQYLLHEIQFHKDALSAVQNILFPAASNNKLKSHFQTVLPHFNRHLEETIKVATALGYYPE